MRAAPPLDQHEAVRNRANRPGTILGKIIDITTGCLLTVGAALGVTCLLMAVAAPLLGIRPLIFLSGSMGPGIPTGSLGIAKDTAARDLHVGDIVTVPLSRGYVTHRIVGITHHGG